MTDQEEQIRQLIQAYDRVHDEQIGHVDKFEITQRALSSLVDALVNRENEAIKSAVENERKLPHGLTIKSYGFDDYDHPTIDRVDVDKYAIRFGRMRFTREGDWIYEPLSSSRTLSFYSKTQFSLEEAFENYPKAIEALESEK